MKLGAVSIGMTYSVHTPKSGHVFALVSVGLYCYLEAEL